MKNYILPVLFFLSLNSFSQEGKFFKMMGYSPVLINENFTAYTVRYKFMQNETVVKEEQNKPRLDNPYYISVRSDNKTGKVKISNKKFNDDLVIYFTKIYQGDEHDDSIMYHFVTKNPNYVVTYVNNFNFNDFLFVTFKNKGNATKINFTISEI